MSSFTNPKRTHRSPETRKCQDVWITTLDGKRVKKTFKCDRCSEVFPMSNAYMESKKKYNPAKGRTHRRLCVECYDKHNGRVTDPPAAEQSNTILEFMK